MGTAEDQALSAGVAPHPHRRRPALPHSCSTAWGHVPGLTLPLLTLCHQRVLWPPGSPALSTARPPAPFPCLNPAQFMAELQDPCARGVPCTWTHKTCLARACLVLLCSTLTHCPDPKAPGVPHQHHPFIHAPSEDQRGGSAVLQRCESGRVAAEECLECPLYFSGKLTHSNLKMTSAPAPDTALPASSERFRGDFCPD